MGKIEQKKDIVCAHLYCITHYIQQDVHLWLLIMELS